jgi:arylsulfatase A-like enzyme
MPRIPIGRPATLALVALLVACARSEPPQLREVARLAALAGEAELSRESRLLRFAAPGAQGQLGIGWDTAGEVEGEPVLWSRGHASLVGFFLAQPRELRLSLRGAAAPGHAPLRVQVQINGQRAGRIVLGETLADHDLRVPAERLVAGENVLRLRYQPGPHAPVAHRRAAWASLALGLTPAPPFAAGGAAGDELVLHPGSEVAFYLELPAGSRLRIDDGALRGGSGALVVSSEGERSGPRQLGELTVGGPGLDLPLNGEEPELCRVAFRAVPAPGNRPGALRLAGARVMAARAETAPSSAAGSRPAPAPPAPPDAAAPGRPNVIVFLVDTLRADRLASYGGDGRLTPHADRFAAGATVYEAAVAQAPWTRPAVASIFTGMWPQDHGTWNLHSVLAPEARTLAELLAGAGYRTAAVSTNGHITGRHGFAQGFDEFRFLVQGEQGVENVLDWTRDWLDRQAGERPFFLYLHTIDPHSPYAAPPEYRRRFAPESLDEDPAALLARAEAASGAERERLVARLRPLYDAEVAYNDAGFGELLAELERRGLLEDALVVFVADHGEEFLDHGELGHGWNFHAETLRVPLLVKYPRQRAGSRDPETAQQVDLLPTILAAAGGVVPPQLPGRDLRRPPDAQRPAFALSHLDHRGRRGYSFVRGGWKLVLPSTYELGRGPQLHLLERGRTARETVGQELRHPLRVRQLRHLLRRELARPRGPLPRQWRALDAETRAELEALGYL